MDKACLEKAGSFKAAAHTTVPLLLSVATSVQSQSELSSQPERTGLDRHLSAALSGKGNVHFYAINVPFFIPSITANSTEFSSVQDGSYALGRVQMLSTPSLRSFPNVASEIVSKTWRTREMSGQLFQ